MIPAIVILAGLVVGLLIGLTGMGGGAVMTPFLILFMKMDPVTAVGTDLVFAACTKWVSGLQHRRQQNVDLRLVGWMAAGSIPASFLMSTLVLTRVDAESALRPALGKMLGVVLVVVSVYTLARTFNWIKVRQDEKWPPAWALALIGAAGGGLVGMTSVGSGTVIMASLLIFYALPSSKLVGLDVMHGALLTTVPAGVYAFGGQVEWQMIAWLLLGSLPGAWLGARLTGVIPQNIVRIVLSILLILAGLKLFG